MHRFRCNLDLRQIEEAEAFTFGNHFMGRRRGAFDEQQELLDGETRLGEDGMAHDEARQVVIYDVEEHLEGRVLHVETTQLGHQGQQR